MPSPSKAGCLRGQDSSERDKVRVGKPQRLCVCSITRPTCTKAQTATGERSELLTGGLCELGSCAYHHESHAGVVVRMCDSSVVISVFSANRLHRLIVNGWKDRRIGIGELQTQFDKFFPPALCKYERKDVGAISLQPPPVFAPPVHGWKAGHSENGKDGVRGGALARWLANAVYWHSEGTCAPEPPESRAPSSAI